MTEEITTPTRAQRLEIAEAASSTNDRWYARIKMKTDPAYGAVIRAVNGSSQPLLDIGCGMGLLGFYLRSAGFRPSIVGIDFDDRKIVQGQSMIERQQVRDMELSCGNALHDLPPFSGTVVILDILQYFTPEQRNDVLQAAAERVSPGGKLIIRSGLKDTSFRFRFTAFTDKLAALIRWMKTLPLTYPTRDDFETVLSSQGFQVEVSPLWGGTPFNNYLIVATRPAQEASS